MVLRGQKAASQKQSGRRGRRRQSQRASSWGQRRDRDSADENAWRVLAGQHVHADEPVRSVFAACSHARFAPHKRRRL
eukprot:5155865-Pleurochrysis_carterae.AAC.1